MSSSVTRKTQLRMLCRSNSNVPGTDLTRVQLGAVYDPNPDVQDHIYGKLTPYGELSFNVTQEVATGLEVGKKYLVDIYLAPDQVVVE